MADPRPRGRIPPRPCSRPLLLAQLRTTSHCRACPGQDRGNSRPSPRGRHFGDSNPQMGTEARSQQARKGSRGPCQQATPPGPQRAGWGSVVTWPHGPRRTQGPAPPAAAARRKRGKLTSHPGNSRSSDTAVLVLLRPAQRSCQRRDPEVLPAATRGPACLRRRRDPGRTAPRTPTSANPCQRRKPGGADIPGEGQQAPRCPLVAPGPSCQREPRLLPSPRPPTPPPRPFSHGAGRARAHST